MSADMEIEHLGLGRLERLDLRSFWGDQVPDLMPWFAQNLDLLSQTLGIDITPLQRELRLDQGTMQVLGTDGHGRPVMIENRLEPTGHTDLGQLVIDTASLESAVVVWVAPRFEAEHKRTLDWLNDRTDDKVDFFAVELGLVRIGRSLPAPVLDVVVQPKGWRKPGRRQAASAPAPQGRHQVHEPALTPAPLLQPPMPPPPPAPTRHQPATPPPLASEKDGGFQTAEVRHRFFEAMFDAVARRRPGFRVPKFGYENWVGFAAGPFGFYDVAFTANGAVRAGVYLDMQERTATKRLFDDLSSERLAIETGVGRILSWERLDDRRASRIVDYRDIRDLGDAEEQRSAAEWAAETVVALMDALDGRLRSTAQILLSRVQGGV